MKKIFLATVFAASGLMLFAQDSTNTINPNTNNANSSTQMNNGTTSSASNQTYNSTSTADYSAYGIPNYVQQNFQTAHPEASNLMWDKPTADWYHGYYSNNNGRYTNVYYSTDPYYNSAYYPERVTGYSVSLPVLETYVPDAVITTATNLYKQNLYDITAVKGANQNLYQVRVLDNGQVRTMWIDSAGTSTADIYRKDDINTSAENSNTINSTQSNAAMDNSNTNMSTNMHDNGMPMKADKHHKHGKKHLKTKMKMKTRDGKKMISKTKNGKSKNWTSKHGSDQQ